MLRCGLDAYRYWHQYTDYGDQGLAGVQHFQGAVDLLAGLESVLLGPGAEEKREGILRQMRTHQQMRVTEAVQVWTQALLVTLRTGG